MGGSGGGGGGGRRVVRCFCDLTLATIPERISGEGVYYGGTMTVSNRTIVGHKDRAHVSRFSCRRSIYALPTPPLSRSICRVAFAEDSFDKK